MKQSELAERFVGGATSGSASNLAIVPSDSEKHTTHLVAYGWAILATRAPGKGGPTIFEGWGEWARERGGRATQSQLAEIRKGFEAAYVGDYREYVTFSDETPQIAEAPASVSDVGSTPRR